MDFTGERYVPSVQGQIKYEHLHRYALCLGFVTGKSVLDIASGEGYGAALLASKAESVTGVDIDINSVEHARRTYCDPKLKFIVGSCECIPLPDAAVDVVTSFETIEHHDKHAEMLNEIKRVLKPGGILIISSPNRLTYSDEPGYRNPFHVKELYYDEFHDLLQERFKHVRIYGQRLATASFVAPLNGRVKSALQPWTGDANEMRPEICALPSPIYFVAICSDTPDILQREDSSVYLDPDNDVLKLFEAERAAQFQRIEADTTDAIRKMQTQVRRTEEALATARFEYESELRRQRDELIETRSRYRITLREREKTIAELREQLRISKEGAITHQAWLSEAKGQMSQHAAMLDWLYTSSAWRVSPFVKDFERWNDRWRRFWNRPSPTPEIFQGMLDYPQAEFPAALQIEIYGWAYSTAAPVRLVQAFLDNHYLGIVRYGIERPDVVAAYPADTPLKCGYTERFWVNDAGLTGDKELRLVVYDEKGNRQVYRRALKIEPVSPAPTVGAVSDRPLLPAAEEMDAARRPTQAAMGPLDEIQSVIADFQARTSSNPSMLDWDSGLKLERFLRNLPICSLASRDATLPHLDGSIDIVVIPFSELERIPEARRVADSAVIRVNGAETGGLEVNWLKDERQSTLSTSIIIPVYNNAKVTQNCLEQLIRTLPHKFNGEIIVVDDASSDETEAVLARWSAAENRIKVLRNPSNLGFLETCNRGAQAASGEILVFLNNDTLPSPDWLPPLLRIFRDKPDAGAVGGKLIYPDGVLQEAGGVIFSDGSGCNFGKRDPAANAPLYSFVREVDYCSGALLATRRDLFIQLGGFDKRFAPAYYEDADYCFTLRANGYRVYYQPESVIVHLEGASCGVDTSAGVKRYQEINRVKFVEKWSAALQAQPNPPRQYDLATLHSLSIRPSWK